VSKGTGQLKQVLEKLYRRYNRHSLIKPDPLQFVYRYSKPRDMEIAGLLAAVLAYGRVQQIERDLTDLMQRLGPSPYEFVRIFDKAQRQKLADFKHRFTSGSDISDLLVLLREVLNEFGSIEAFFAEGYRSNDANIIGALSNFCDSLLDMHAKKHNGSVPKGLSYLLPRPTAGSACKRLNLFLRWMVRGDQVDTGLWKMIDKSKLIVPVDVHMGRLCRVLGLYTQKTVSLSAAVRITEGFARMEPADPVKYDFALCRTGMLGKAIDWDQASDCALGG
jgi:uncharacterized protein (TIGR02757 family)